MIGDRLLCSGSWPVPNFLMLGVVGVRVVHGTEVEDLA